MNSERLHVLSTDQRTFIDTKEEWLHVRFVRKIKQSRASKQSDQVIKDDFNRSRFLIPVANASTGNAYVTTPCKLKCNTR